MKDARLIELRLRAERDVALSDGAFRLLCRLVSEKYNSPVFFAEESFGLPWTMVRRLCDLSERQAYRRIDELLKKYLAGGELKGCPPVAQYHFLLNSAKNGRLDSAKNGGINSAKNGRDHISNPLRGKNSEEKEGIRARQGRGDGGEGIKERGRTASENGARVKSLAEAMRKAAS